MLRIIFAETMPGNITRYVSSAYTENRL